MNEELRRAIESEQDIRIDPVPTPEWPSVDGKIFVRTLNLTARDAYLVGIRSDIPGEVTHDKVRDKSELAGVRLVIAAACDEQGNTMFSDGDIAMLVKKSWAPMQRMIDAAADLNGLSKKSRDDAKNVSPSAATSGSSTD